MYFNHKYSHHQSRSLAANACASVDALAIKIERLRIEEVLKITFQVVFVVVLLPTHVTVQGSKKMVVRRGEVRAVWRVGQHLPDLLQQLLACQPGSVRPCVVVEQDGLLSFWTSFGQFLLQPIELLTAVGNSDGCVSQQQFE